MASRRTKFRRQAAAIQEVRDLEWGSDDSFIGSFGEDVPSMPSGAEEPCWFDCLESQLSSEIADGAILLSPVNDACPQAMQYRSYSPSSESSSQSSESSSHSSSAFTLDCSDSDIDWGSLSDGSIESSDDDIEHQFQLLLLDHERPTIRSELKLWFMEYNVTVAALKGLLEKLDPFIAGLPKDPRTIIGKIAIPEIVKMDSGEYCYMGLKNQLVLALSRCQPQGETVELNFHVDGLPVMKSKNFQLLPILFTMQHTSDFPPTVVALYAGVSKPALSNFLKDFVPELTDVLREGLFFDNVQYKVKVRAFICDAPARAYIKGCKYHSGTFSCQFCTQRGRKVQYRQVFPEMNAPLRTDESFASRDQPEHHNEHSPLTETGVGMVSQFPLDYQHLVLLGVVRTLLALWVLGKVPFKLSPSQIRRMNEALVMLTSRWPCDFSRKPRTLDDLKYWKATEFRQFILYLCVVILKSRLDVQRYNHFLLLHVAITIMCREDLHETMLAEAHRYLVEFVIGMREIYGQRFQYYNFHSLLHLSSCVEVYGCLDNFSAFPFESYLNTLKRLVVSKKKPLLSLLNKLFSKTEAGVIPGMPKSKSTEDMPVRSSRHYGGPCGTVRGTQYRKYTWHSTVLSNCEGDNCVILKNKKVFVIQNIVCNSTGDYIVGVEFRRKEDAYRYPCRSSILGIFRVTQLSVRPVAKLIGEVEWKAVLIPFKRRLDDFVVFPLRK